MTQGNTAQLKTSLRREGEAVKPVDRLSTTDLIAEYRSAEYGKAAIENLFGEEAWTTLTCR